MEKAPKSKTTGLRYGLILLRQLVVTDFKLRYQGSVLGYIWSLLRPLIMFLILLLVFGSFLKVGRGIPNYPIYLLMGIVLWTYFAEVTIGAVGIIVARGELIRKIKFPRSTIVLAGSFSALINLVLNLIVVTIFMAKAHIGLQASAVYILPLILELFIVSLAAAFFLSAAFVRFRDINYIWELIMQAAFYATPIIYPLSAVPHRYAKVLLLSPVAQIIQDFRASLLGSDTITLGTLYHHEATRLLPICLSLILLGLSVLYFKRQAKSFAEDV